MTFRDFSNGLADFGVQIDDSDIKTLFKYLDKSGTGKVDLGELLDELRGQEISFVRSVSYTHLTLPTKRIV